MASDVVAKGHSNRISIYELSVKGQVRRRSNVTGKDMNSDEEGHESTSGPSFSNCSGDYSRRSRRRDV